MRRTFPSLLPLRPTAPLRLPPPLLRLLVAGGLVVADVFLAAHRREYSRIREESASRGESAAAAEAMAPAEALELLGLASGLAVPLRDEARRREATQRFQRLFAMSKELDNVFLQGKFSAAYRVCVDKDWDAKEESGDFTSGGRSGGS